MAQGSLMRGFPTLLTNLIGSAAMPSLSLLQAEWQKEYAYGLAQASPQPVTVVTVSVTFDRAVIAQGESAACRASPCACPATRAASAHALLA